MKKKNINSLRLNKESIANLKGIFGGKDQENTVHTRYTKNNCPPHTRNTICYEEDTIHLEVCIK